MSSKKLNVAENW